MSDLVKRLKNPGTIIAIASCVVYIFTINGVIKENTIILDTVKALCAIGVLLGVLNNPDTHGIDNPIKELKK